MKLQLDKDSESIILTVFIMDDTATDGSGLAGLVHGSGITGGYVRMGGIGVALTCDEDVATEGTYQAPSAAAKVRIGTPANMDDGIYELHFHNDLFATGAESVTISLSQAADMAPLIIEVQLMEPVPDVNVASTDDIDLSVTQKASVNTEADNAIISYGLDHLVSATVAGGDITDNSIIAKLVSKDATADWDDYVNTTDSLQAIRDGLTDAAADITDMTTTIRVFNGTAAAAGSTTLKVMVQAGDPPVGGADDDYNNTILCIYDGASKATARFNMRVVDDYDDSDPSFTVSPALGFTPDDGDLVEVFRADSGALSLLSVLASGFSATSPNRLIDHLRSIMSKGAVTPSSMGTYDPAVDSLEYASERRALMEGAGFSTSTDSLEAIRDAITTLIAPNVVSASSLSGSGFLSDIVSLVRKATDEPSQSPKYTDGDIVEYVQAGMDAVITDIQSNTDHPIIVRYSITLVAGTQFYILPPNVAELIRIAKINTNSDLAEYEVWPGSHMNPGGHGWKLEGNVLRLLRDWDSSDVLELMYHPNSEPAMHKGTAEDIGATTVTLMETPTDGTLGKRPNEYVGMLLRILSSDQNYVEERMITDYDLTTRIATVAKAWDTTPTGTVVYEVVPIYSRLIKHVVALRTSIDILSNEGNSQRMATLNQNYVIKVSAMRRALARMEGRFPHHFDGDTWDNSNRGGFFYGA